MPPFGSELTSNSHFHTHLKQQIPVQVYRDGAHEAIGHVTGYNRFFIEIGGSLYNRKAFTFISRPGY